MGSFWKAARLRSILLGAAASIAVAGPALAQEQTVQFHIAAQNTASALNEFSRQAGVQILFPFDVASRTTSPALEGSFTRADAIARLTQGTSLRLASDDGRTIVLADSSSPTRLGDASGAAPSDSEEEITVTGTRIRGAGPNGAQVLTVTREDIEQSGYATVADALKNVPQVAPSVSTDFEPVSSYGGLGNFGGGTGLDLRGLGVGTTLVLINGHRLPRAGEFGRFSDISSIPTAAIERIEILLDGASAIYGSDAIGGVVNIILRNDYRGAETNLRLGTMNGDAGDYQASQVFGTSWSSGNLFAGVEYTRRERLAAHDRSFAASCDQAPRGGDNFCSTFSNPANILDPNTFEIAYAIPPGQDGTSLSVSDLLPGVTNFAPTTDALSPDEQTTSAFLNFSQHLTNRVEIHFDGRYVDRPSFARFGSGVPIFLEVPSTNPFYVNPFPGQAFCSSGAPDCVYLFYDLYRDLQPTISGDNRYYEANLSANIDLGRDWQMRALAGYSREEGDFRTITFNQAALDAALASTDPNTAFNPFGDGSYSNPAVVDSVRQELRSETSSDISTISVDADGPVLRLPTGTVRLAVGASHVRDAMAFTDFDQGPASGDLSRQINSAYFELSVPILGDSDPGAQSLLLSLAARYDQYSDFGDTTNPKIGLTWRPNSTISLRGTWGTSFHAPDLTQRALPGRDQPVDVLAQFFPDPLSPSGFSNVLYRQGYVPDLGPETATTWSTGIDITPERTWLPNFSITYTDITYQDRIAPPGDPGNPRAILAQGDLWADVTIRNPTPQQVADFCNSPTFFGSVSACLASNPAAIFDGRVRNLAYTRSQSVDFRIEKEIDFDEDSLSLRLAGVYNLSNERGLTETSPRLDILDTIGNPLSLRMRGSAEYRHGELTFFGAINYTPSYRDTIGGLSNRQRDIDSWITMDARLTYEPQSIAALRGTSLSLVVVNVLNEDPPWVNNLFGYDGGNADAFGRVLSLQLRHSW